MGKHPIVHLELAAKDPAAEAKFYREAFGWEIEVDPQYDYHQFKAEGGPAGGFVRVDNTTYKQGDIIPYIQTDDIDAALKKVESLGGKTLQPKTPIQGVGAFAFFADPAGNRVGLFQTGPA